MSLSAALNTAKSSLAASQLQTQIVSSNIANVNTAGATRKIANVVTGPNGQVTVTSIAQSSNTVLFRNMLDATSKLTAATMQAEAYARMNEVVGDTNAKQSPQAKIVALNDALTSLANTPGNYDLARNVAQAAQDLVTTIRSNAETVQTIRRDADTHLANAADDMNRILKDLEAINRQVVTGTNRGEDVTDQSDQRDRLVKQLSEYVGVSVRTRGSNDLVVYTDSGVTLLENTARTVSFEQSGSLAPGSDGNAFFIDGVAVTGKNSYMPVKSGMIFGLTDVRDRIANTYGMQLDEMARGLVAAFSEHDQTGVGGGVAKAGLFTTDQPIETTATAAPTLNVDPTSLSDSDVIEFDVTFEGVVYKVSGTTTSTDRSSAGSFAGRLQAMIADARTTNGDALGRGRVGVSAAGGTLTLVATGVGESIDFSISNPNPKAATAGIAAVSTPPVVDATYAGLAGSLELAAGVFQNPEKVRDGVSYDYNSTDLGGFSGRIVALSKALDTQRFFSAAANADPKATLSGFATSSISWLQDARSASSRDVTSLATLVTKTEETLSSEAGINLDVELTRLIELERSYQASAKIISTVDQMLAQLLQSI